MKRLKVLFACIENSFRSQIAEGVARTFFNDYIEAYSAGSNPSGTVHPNAIAVLKEIGADTSLHKSKGFLELGDIQFDFLVTMGCGEVCPFHPALEHISWELPDIKNNPLNEIRSIRDDIKRKLESLLEGMNEQ